MEDFEVEKEIYVAGVDWREAELSRDCFNIHGFPVVDNHNVCV